MVNGPWQLERRSETAWGISVIAGGADNSSVIKVPHHGMLSKFSNGETIMRAKTLSAAVALMGLVAFAGTTFAVDDTDGGQLSDYGKISRQSDDTMGKAAYGTPTDPMAWSDSWRGHDAYNRTFFGTSGVPLQLDAMGTDSIGKAAYGTRTAGVDGHVAYQNTFIGD